MIDLSTQNRINQEIDTINEAIEQLEIFLSELTNQAEAIYQEALVNSIALNLHGIYTGIERIFEIIAKEIDCRLPTGDKWHRDLLDQMAVNIPNVRKAVIREETRLLLDELRRFRHVVRSAYSFQLDKEKVLIMANQISNTCQEFINEIRLFLNSFSNSDQSE